MRKVSITVVINVLFLGTFLCRNLHAQVILPILDIEVLGVAEYPVGTLWLVTSEGLYFSTDGISAQKAGEIQDRLSSIAVSVDQVLVGGENGIAKVIFQGEDFSNSILQSITIVDHPEYMISVPSGGVVIVTSDFTVPPRPNEDPAHKDVSYYNSENTGYIKNLKKHLEVLGVDREGRLWASGSRQLFRLDDQAADFVPVDDTPGMVRHMVDTGEAIFFIEQELNASNRPSNFYRIHHWEKSRGRLRKQAYRFDGEIFGKGSVDGALWISIYGKLYSFDDDSGNLTEQLIDTGEALLTSGQAPSFRWIEEAEKHILLAGDGGVLVRKQGEDAVRLLSTWKRNFTDVFRSSKGLILWGVDGAFRFWENVSIDMNFESLLSILGADIVIGSELTFSKPFYAENGTRSRTLERNIERRLILAESRKELVERMNVSGDRGYEPYSGRWVPESKYYAKIHISALDPFGNRADLGRRSFFFVTGAPEFVFRILSLFIVLPIALTVMAILPSFLWRVYLFLWWLWQRRFPRRLLRLSPRNLLALSLGRSLWLRNFSLWLRKFFFSILFMNMALVPRVFRRYWIFSFSPVARVYRGICVDSLHQKYLGGSLQHDGGTVEEFLEEILEERLKEVSADETQISPEAIVGALVRSFEGMGDLRKAVPVVCDFSCLPDVSHPGVLEIVESAVASSLGGMMWLADKEFSEEQLRRGRFLFLFRYNRTSTYAKNVIRCFFLNSGLQNFMVLFGEDGYLEGLGGSPARRDRPAKESSSNEDPP